MAASIESAAAQVGRVRARSGVSVAVPLFVASAFVLTAAGAAIAAPVWLSIIAVFVFAGPHNWIEARYFLARLPGRWGRSRTFYVLAIGGAVTMTAFYLAMGPFARALELSDAGVSAVIASWATVAVAWCVALVAILGRQTGRDWTWAVPVGLFVVAFAWWSPGLWWLGLVYGHPLVALIFLDRELRRSPALQKSLRSLWAILPLALVAIAVAGGSAGPIGGMDGLTMRIADHAGATILPSIPDRVLVGSHAFLETVHYGVWVLAMPWLGFRTSPLRMTNVPLGRRPGIGAWAVVALLAGGAALVVVLWVAFAIDYGTTRDVYFAAAMLHVLVEVPFLIRIAMPRGVVRDAR